MKVYGDKLTEQNLYEALPKRVGFDGIMPISRPRVRTRGWTVRLTGMSTNRHRNSGTHGADVWDTTPATWDEHGQWMARLFDIDPDARIAYYAGRDDFHAKTAGKYQGVSA